MKVSDLSDLAALSNPTPWLVSQFRSTTGDGHPPRLRGSVVGARVRSLCRAHLGTASPCRSEHKVQITVQILGQGCRPGRGPREPLERT